MGRPSFPHKAPSLTDRDCDLYSPLHAVASLPSPLNQARVTAEYGALLPSAALDTSYGKLLCDRRTDLCSVVTFTYANDQS